MECTAIKIHLYTMCWNERRMLPYFLRHYEQFCDSIIVYDNESDDGSQDIVREHPLCDLRRISSGGQKENRLLRYVKGKLWKESRGRADWVICCDVDELLYHPHLMEFLEDCGERGVTLPIPTAWQMVHPQFPTDVWQIYNEVRTGYVDPVYSKWVIFDPNAIQEINYGMGCHHAKPQGDIRFRNDPLLKLLHFKFLGLDWVIERYAELAQRMSTFDR